MLNAAPDAEAEYEAQFASRFTEEDEEFQQRVRSGAQEPPVLEGWRSARGGGGGGARYRDTRLRRTGQSRLELISPAQTQTDRAESVRVNKPRSDGHSDTHTHTLIPTLTHSL
uniref:RNMT-activating mini protein n=1 Tax=Pygocentrus nattereri TaxID=42514 RepID=A0A3B4D5S8_PYGNA